MFEFLFKYPAAVFSKGSLVLLGSWPQWVLWILIVAAAAALGFVVWQRRNRISPSLRGAKTVIVWCLQTALVALLLFLLWQPALSIATLKPQHLGGEFSGGRAAEVDRDPDTCGAGTLGLGDDGSGNGSLAGDGPAGGICVTNCADARLARRG